MSAVMTKVALYGMIRIVFDLVGVVPWWFGGLMMAIGGITAVVGVLFAIVEQDIKRLLAYSTVENIGIVVTGLGLAVAFRDSGMPAIAALAFAAALLHILNHSVFKSLLFLGAGAVVSATGTRDLARLGGLIHRMPQTAFGMLIGAGAISALPPLNGFVSEWLLFQAILKGPQLPEWELKIATAIIAALLALAAALAATCFVRAFGIAFLGSRSLARSGGGARNRTLHALADLGPGRDLRCPGHPAAARPDADQRGRRGVDRRGRGADIWRDGMAMADTSGSGRKFL
jgi:formate hydrogenlyase subunit 3/multisubunit Na+/H+ antiporter MnhD subunit